MRNIILLILLTVVASVQASESHTVLVYNVGTKETVLSENADVIRPMASITKLMTAMIALDRYELSDKLPTGKKSSATVEQLLIKLLVRSDNGAAEVLARNYPQGRTAFIRAMNDRSAQLGLVDTKFSDPSGLMPNTSSAKELVKLVAASGNYNFIRRISSQPAIYQTSQVKKKTKTITLANTNSSILIEFNNILISKTGFTHKAGRCLAMLVDKNGQEHVIIILGERTKQSRDQLARNLMLASSANY
jgi:D-alanyl-D-alanine endopeptidase (penicillin-binding protein 7)